MAQKDAKQTLVDAVNYSFESRLGRLERAMRDWSRTDPRAHAAIERRTKSRSRRWSASFEFLGFTPEEADIRAKTLFFAGVGFSDVGPRLGDQADPQGQLKAMMELLTRRD